LNLVIV